MANDARHPGLSDELSRLVTVENGLQEAGTNKKCFGEKMHLTETRRSGIPADLGAVLDRGPGVGIPL